MEYLNGKWAHSLQVTFGILKMVWNNDQSCPGKIRKLDRKQGKENSWDDTNKCSIFWGKSTWISILRIEGLPQHLADMRVRRAGCQPNITKQQDIHFKGWVGADLQEWGLGLSLHEGTLSCTSHMMASMHSPATYGLQVMSCLLLITPSWCLSMIFLQTICSPSSSQLLGEKPGTWAAWRSCFSCQGMVCFSACTAAGAPRYLGTT